MLYSQIDVHCACIVDALRDAFIEKTKIKISTAYPQLNSYPIRPRFCEVIGWRLNIKTGVAEYQGRGG